VGILLGVCHTVRISGAIGNWFTEIRVRVRQGPFDYIYTNSKIFYLIIYIYYHK
jgi:hypothetical protein